MSDFSTKLLVAPRNTGTRPMATRKHLEARGGVSIGDREISVVSMDRPRELWRAATGEPRPRAANAMFELVTYPEGST